MVELRMQLQRKGNDMDHPENVAQLNWLLKSRR